jgi:hypothetical protein
MQQQRTCTPADEDTMIDAAVLGLLIHRDDQRPWSKDEIDREIGQNSIDSLNRLYGAGLLHRLKGFFWATRAAIVADEISF